jgi:hypothetical protein
MNLESGERLANSLGEYTRVNGVGAPPDEGTVHQSEEIELWAYATITPINFSDRLGFILIG